MLLSINAVQNFVVDRAAQFASRKLETVVRIDRVDIGIFDRITLEGLYVEDYGGDTLLYVGNLHAFITQFGIFSNGFTLRHGRLTDGKFYLREMPDGVMNVKQIVSRMGRKEKKEESDFRLSISALTVENLEFRLEKTATSQSGLRDRFFGYGHPRHRRRDRQFHHRRRRCRCRDRPVFPHARRAGSRSTISAGNSFWPTVVSVWKTRGW